jgi:hypothetical protein
MPTTTQDHVESQELVFPAAGERRELVGRPEWTGGGAPVADPSSLSPELVDEAVDRAGGRRRVRQALRMPSGRISDELIDELLAGASTEEEIAGPGGLLADLTKRLVERAMEVELTEHVGYEPHLRAAWWRREPAQRHDAEGVDLRAREGSPRRSPRPGRRLPTKDR